MNANVSNVASSTKSRSLFFVSFAGSFAKIFWAWLHRWLKMEPLT